MPRWDRPGNGSGQQRAHLTPAVGTNEAVRQEKTEAQRTVVPPGSRDVPPVPGPSAPPLLAREAGPAPGRGPPQPAPLQVSPTPPEAQGSEPGAALSSARLGAGRLGTAEALSSCPDPQGGPGGQRSVLPAGLQQGTSRPGGPAGRWVAGRSRGRVRGSGRQPRPGLPGRPPLGPPAGLGSLPVSRSTRRRRPRARFPECLGAGRGGPGVLGAPPRKAHRRRRGWGWGRRALAAWTLSPGCPDPRTWAACVAEPASGTRPVLGGPALALAPGRRLTSVGPPSWDSDEGTEHRPSQRGKGDSVGGRGVTRPIGVQLGRSRILPADRGSLPEPQAPHSGDRPALQAATPGWRRGGGTSVPGPASVSPWSGHQRSPRGSRSQSVKGQGLEPRACSRSPQLNGRAGHSANG